ncbi:hypothetical protein H104_03107 [Trichophyton rubrum CBS 289.86]|nr:hypothetical protein H104_03107 [Trichophyton rubrum CBS 289.86]
MREPQPTGQLNVPGDGRGRAAGGVPPPDEEDEEEFGDAAKPVGTMMGLFGGAILQPASEGGRERLCRRFFSCFLFRFSLSRAFWRLAGGAGRVWLDGRHE